MSSDMEKRLFELKLKMNKAKQLNNQAVVSEKQREADPKWFLKQKDSSGEAPQYATVDPSEALLNETAETALMKTKKKKSNETFGWDVFNEDSLYRAHDKRVNEIGFYPDAYLRQKDALGSQAFYPSSSSVTGAAHKPSDDAKERLADSLKQAEAKRKKFSRRRVYDEDEQVEWINERNRHFTKKIERAFGQHTKEIKGNLERGTAL